MYVHFLQYFRMKDIVDFFLVFFFFLFLFLLNFGIVPTIMFASLW